MQTKTVPAYKFISKSVTTTLDSITSAGRPIADELGKIITEGKITPTGPMQFNYYGLMDNNPDTEFTLEVGIPVGEDQESVAEFEVKELPEYLCVYTNHNGDYASLGQTYEAMMEDIASEGKNISGINREVYTKMDSENAANNVTEVQLGLV